MAQAYSILLHGNHHAGFKIIAAFFYDALQESKHRFCAHPFDADSNY